MNSRLHVTNRKDWRQWLSENHLEEKEIWLVYHKKHTGKPRIPYEDAVEEALCFGWIDSIVRKIDSDKYMQKFTPRKDNSDWSDSNKKRVRRLIDSGKMTPAGLKIIDRAKSNGSWDRSVASSQAFEMPVQFERALAANESARDFFNSLSPSYQKQYIGWIASAKKVATKQRRATEAVSLLSRKQKLGMK